MGFFREFCDGKNPPPDMAITDCSNASSHIWACVNNKMEDAELFESMKISSILGVMCLFLFGFLQAVFLPYRIRQMLPQVTVKPRRLPNRGFQMIWKWLYLTIFTSDQHLLASSGLDALILVKTMGFGVQLFMPLAIIATAVLIPIHKNGKSLANETKEGKPAGKLMELTMSNVSADDDVLWVHLVCVYAIIGYALLLLYFQQRRFMKMRHIYLTAGDDPNVWREKFQAEGLRNQRPQQATTSTPAEPTDGDAPKQSKSNVGKKVSNIVKTFTGLGETDDLTSPLIFGRKGIMTAASNFQADEDGLLLDILGKRQARGSRTLPVPRSSGEPIPEIEPSDPSPPDQSQSGFTSITLPKRIAEADDQTEPSPRGPSAFGKLVDVFAKTAKAPTLHKWWDMDLENPASTDDEAAVLTPEDGGDDAREDMFKGSRLTSRPSIRNLRTVNTFDTFLGEKVAVNAQQYCVLVTDVPDIEKMIMRRAKVYKEKKGLMKIWDFLYRWVGGGFSLKTFHPSANVKAVARQQEKQKDLAHQSILSLSQDVRLKDALLDKVGDGDTSPEDFASKWGKIATKVSNEDIFHMEEMLVEESFKGLFSVDFLRAVPIRNHKEVDDLLIEWDGYARRLESAEEYLERTGRRIEFRRWTCGGLFTCFSKEGELELVDEITHCKFHIARLEGDIFQAQKRILRGRTTSSWLLIFRTQHSATIAAQTLLHSESTHKFKAYPAPGPEEMNWQALWKTWVEKDVRSILVFPVLVFLCLVPIGLAMGAVTRFNNFLCSDNTRGWYWKAYCEKKEDDALNLRSLATSWLPPLIVAIWQNAIMPRCLYYLVQAQARCISLSQLDREITSIFFYWDVFNIFIGGMMGGTIFNSQFFCGIGGAENVLAVLGNAVPGSANFFVNYLALRAFLLVPYQFLAPHPGIWLYLLKLGGACGCARTKRAKAMLYRPASIRYGREYGILLLIFLISLSYSVVAPIIVPITLLFFVVSWLTWRYQVLYVYVRKYESGGRMWPVVFNRILFCLFFFQFFTSCVLIIKKAFLQATILIVTVPVILIRFSSYCKERFQSGMAFVPLEMAFHSPPTDVDPIVYTPPGLVKGCPGWHPEYMKAWEGWGAPGYSV